jgi:hypothetical protein
MLISLADSTERGFKKWSTAHTENGQPGGDEPEETGAGHPDIGPDIGEAAAFDGPHQPWLVPGVGNVL